LFTVYARAANESPLTLEEACGEALARNPGIAEASAEWDAARERVAQAGAWEDLQVSGMSKAGRFVSAPRNGFADQTVTVSQMIPISGRNMARARAAAEEALVAYEELRRRELDVAQAARVAYYGLEEARGQAELNRKSLALLAQMAKVSQTRYEAGKEGGAEVLGGETEGGKAQEEGRELERRVAAEETALNVAMGRDAFAPVGEIEEGKVNFPEAPVEELKATMMANRPELRSAEHKAEAARARLGEARRAWIPDPALTVEAQRYDGAGQGISEVDAGVTFNVPWTNERKYAAGTREAAAEVAAADAEVAARKVEAVGLLRSAIEDVTTARHHAHLSAETLVKEAEAGLKASEIGYEAGSVGLGDWLGAARTEQEVTGMRLEEMRDYEVAVGELEAVVGDDHFQQMKSGDR